MDSALVLGFGALLTAVSALANWWAVAGTAAGSGARRRVEVLAKPATMVGLFLVALVLGSATTQTRHWLLIAIVLCALGDVFLLGEGEGRFRAGLAAFLLGHLAYIAAFLAHGLDRPAWSVVGIAILSAALVLGRRILPTVWAQSGPALGVPVAAYMGVIGAMGVTGWATGRFLVGLGTALFVTSDTLLALNRFVAARAHARLAVMVTYHLAQVLIVVGLLGT